MSHIRQSEVENEDGNIFYKIDLNSFNSVVMLSVEEYDELITIVENKISAIELEERVIDISSFEVENGIVYHGDNAVNKKIEFIVASKFKRYVEIIEWVKIDSANHYSVKYRFQPIMK